MPARRAKDPRQHITQSALACFSLRGVSGTSVQEVADKARVSKQALMHHFPTKERLRDAVYELVAQRLRDELPALAGDLVSQSSERYRTLLAHTLHRFSDAPELCRFLVFELLERPESVLSWLRDEAAPWLGLVRGVVRQAKSKQAFDTEAHLAVVGWLLLAQAALVPRSDARWRRRTQAATLKVITLGSHLG